MGGRESASAVGSVPGSRSRVSESVVAALEEPSTESRRRASRGRDRGPEKAIDQREELPVMYTSCFVQ